MARRSARKKTTARKGARKSAAPFSAPDNWVKAFQAKARKERGKRYTKAEVLSNRTFRKYAAQMRRSRSSAPGTKGYEARERLGLVKPLAIKPLKGGEIDPDIPAHFVDAYRKLIRRTRGERWSDTRARKDGRLQALWRDFKRAKGKQARGKRARILVELGLRQEQWSFPVGDSPRT